jgi:O-methyltransferase
MELLKKDLRTIFAKVKEILVSPPAREEHTVLYDKDVKFHSLYEKGLLLSGTPDRGSKRKKRFFNLIQALKSTEGVDGDVAECGCWKGLSSFLICNYLSIWRPVFKGERFFVIDSFEGLSEPTQQDLISYNISIAGKDRKGKAFKPAGAYFATQESVMDVLHQWPAVTYIKGWIPEVLPALKEQKFKFVHIDLDLYEPILGALRFFYPRMQKGGVIVCDDYGSLFWPGAKQAVEQFCSENQAYFVTNDSGSALIIKF